MDLQQSPQPSLPPQAEDFLTEFDTFVDQFGAITVRVVESIRDGGLWLVLIGAALIFLALAGSSILGHHAQRILSTSGKVVIGLVGLAFILPFVVDFIVRLTN